ncbi:S1C family serine protease [Arhodomonas sp. KWT]|uniref:S1C family serine protease n=1 Tax=Arhodomonas sp. KWT TaxID=2679915 RepID=UPI001969DAAA|nr:trypsin-like peptidase domain-containing protein [Arhodomonas sp. KWT]
MLDAYSRAVTAVVDAVAPAVVSLAVTGGRDGGAVSGSGSGVVLTPDGHVLTNSHVVTGARAVEVRMNDGATRTGDVIGNDPSTDLAVVWTRGGRMPCLALEETPPLKPGQLAIAIGNPYGYDASVSTGVISALGRVLRGVDGRLIDNVIQHTAPLNPGNSGGALLDSHGRLIGINTAIVAPAQAIGFAIPATTARVVLAQILAFGRVRRAHLGIAGRVRRLDRRLVRTLGLPADSAVEVAEVTAGGPAAGAGLRTGDYILAADGTATPGMDALFRVLSGAVPDGILQLDILRRTTRLTISLALREAPGVAGAAS